MGKPKRNVFDRMEDGSLFKGFLVAWAIWALVCMAGVAAVVWVAVHFLSKVW